jgi:hypothetical protein
MFSQVINRIFKELKKLDRLLCSSQTTVLVDYETDFIVCVSAQERRPEHVSELFDGFNVKAFTCDDGLPNIDDLNDPVVPFYRVGETYRICIEPDTDFIADYNVVGFRSDVICTNPKGQRVVIRNNDEVFDDLTKIDRSKAVQTATNLKSILAFEDTVTDNFVLDTATGERASGTFNCQGSVLMYPKVLGLPTDLISLPPAPPGTPPTPVTPPVGDSVRRLQEGETLPDAVTGTFKLEITIVEDEKLSTGAIVGISMAGFAAFLVVLLVTLFIMHRRGCFDKRKNSKPPKTIDVEESSETSGEEAA